jgi:putative membrane protein
MIVYDKHKWWVLGTAFKGTVIKRMLVRISILLAITVTLAVLQDFKYKIPTTNSTIHSLLGTALGLLLVFRTNASYVSIVFVTLLCIRLMLLYTG